MALLVPRRITKRTPIETITARRLVAGATVLTNDDTPITIEKVVRCSRAHVRLWLEGGQSIEVSPSAPMRVYVEAPTP